jgi:hypothetical protein
MKKIVFYLASIFVATISFSQISEGKVTYDLNFNSSIPEVKQQLAMMQGSKFINYFSPDFFRSEMDMGMIMKQITITDYKKGEAILLIDGIVGKKAAKMNSSDVKPEQHNIELEKTDETKKIAGFLCNKVIAHVNDDLSTVMWITNEISTSAAENIKYFNGKIEGYPLEFEIEANGVALNFKATEVEKNLKKYNKKDLFDMTIPKDFEEIDPNDLEGLGF